MAVSNYPRGKNKKDQKLFFLREKNIRSEIKILNPKLQPKQNGGAYYLCKKRNTLTPIHHSSS